MIPVIIIQGPTAVGKSALALRLAEELNSEIISADSRQVYKLLNIGTAKPSREEQEKIKHHLIDIVYPDQNYSAGDFAKDAFHVIKNLNEHNKIPIIVGGTGFYIQSLVEGIFDAPDISPEIRINLKQTAIEKGTKFLYERLKKIDPDSAERTEPNDLNRVIRALEVYEATGKTITQHWQQQVTHKKIIQAFNIFISDDRDALYERINKRVDAMLEKGLLQEMNKLLKIGYGENDPGMNTVGYKELFPFFSKEKKLEKCIEEIKKHTRNYAKRQFTWFRKIDFDLTLQVNKITFLNVLEKILEFYEIYSDRRWDDHCQNK